MYTWPSVFHSVELHVYVHVGVSHCFFVSVPNPIMVRSKEFDYYANIFSLFESFLIRRITESGASEDIFWVFPVT